MNRNYLRPLLALVLSLSADRAAAQLSVTNPALPVAVSSLNAVSYISAPITASNSTSEFLAVGTNNQVASWTYTNVFVATNLVASQFNDWTNLTIPTNLLRAPNLLNTVVASPSTFFVTGQSNRVFGLAGGTTNWLAVGTKGAFLNTAYGSGLAYNSSNNVLVEVAEAPEIAWLDAGTPFAITNNTWTNALGSFSFSDSFRTVTAFSLTNLPTTNFVACGIYGAMYASTNGGLNWVGGINTNANVSQSPFYGVASDGQNTLVCVGGGGSISVFTGNKTSILSLEKVVTNVPATQTLLGVTYLDPADGFVAVGTDANGAGVAWQSLNATNWAPISLFSSNKFPFRAIAYGAGGYLQGVGVVAGTSSNLNLFATPPPLPVNITADSQTNFVGLTADPLVVSVTNGYPVGTETVDWYASPTNPTPISYGAAPTAPAIPLTNVWCLLSNGVSYFYPPVPTTNITADYIFYARARDLRTGIVSTNFTAVTNHVYKAPAAFVFGSTNVCNGQSVTAYATLAGTPPFNVTWLETWGNQSVALVVTNYTTTNISLTINSSGTFFVTNTLPNADTNYVITITNLTDHVFTNNIFTNINLDPLTGQMNITVHPRPAASLLSFISTDCNEGPAYVLTNSLSGEGPWTVYWNDGYVQTTNAPSGSNVFLLRTVYPTNALGADLVATNVYYVTNVVDADACVGNEPGDITGAVTNFINPRPTASLLSFVSTDCNEGPVYTLTNILTGIGPWTIVWDDGYLQTTNAPLGSPAFLLRTVHPSNRYGANVVSNNVFYVTYVVDGTGCVADQPGDILGFVTNAVDPRPTSILYAYNTTNCDIGSPVWLTNILTGIGPWTNTWYLAGVTNQLAVGTNGQAGPYTNIWAVYSTNGFMANSVSNNAYYILGVMDGTLCLGDQPGDIQGTVTNSVEPRPTSVLLSYNITNCDIGAPLWLTNILTGIGPWTNTWFVSGVTNVQVVGTAGAAGPYTNIWAAYSTNGFMANSVSNNVYYLLSVENADACSGSEGGDVVGVVTNTVNPRPTSVLLSYNITNCDIGAPLWLTNILTGIGPWTNTWYSAGVTNLMVVGTNGQAGPYTNIWAAYSTNIFAPNSASNNVYYLLALENADVCGATESGDLKGVVTNVVYQLPAAPLAPSGLAGETTNLAGDIYETNVIGGPVALTVAVPGGQTANWYDWTSNNVVTNGSVIYLPTNGVAGLYTNYAQAWNTNTGCVSAALARVILVLIPPAPLSAGNQTNCAGVINPPLVVTLPAPVDGASVNWYGTNDSGLVIEPNGTATNSFVATNTTVGSYTFYAQTVAHGLSSTNLTPVTLTLQSCTAAPMLLSLGMPPTNSIVTWYGNLLLESTTNLATTPIIWITNSAGLPGVTNSWTNTMPLPDQFFRLYAPTN